MRTLVKGNSGYDVYQLQEYLQVSADGVFGPGTEAAVKKLQTAHSLWATGIVDSSTMSALKAEMEKKNWYIDDKLPDYELIKYDVPLIPQPNSTSCWAASLAMILNYWGESTTVQGVADEVGLSLDTCYAFDVFQSAINKWGFCKLPENAWGPYTWMDWLRGLGPLYVSIRGVPFHAVVLIGTDGGYFRFNDPWLPHKGSIHTVNYQRWRDLYKAGSARVYFLW